MEKPPFFSIIIVCLNPGEKLKLTLDSIAMQIFNDYEVIIKDGVSKDGAIDKYVTKVDERLRLYIESDEGIYDAMNQAVRNARGQVAYFLNCGDLFRDGQVLAKVKKKIDESSQGGIFYGNIFELVTGQEVSANPGLNPRESRFARFACYRNLPCHQACFYSRDLLLAHPFVLKYRVMADYEHFLWCVLERETETHFMPFVIASYEGAGFSETKKNRKKSMREHQEIVRLYMSKTEILTYRLILLLTLQPLRTMLSRNKLTTAIYNRLKKRMYQ
jgi:glycosyltransferase involved in cell wall biosynthesis